MSKISEYLVERTIEKVPVGQTPYIEIGDIDLETNSYSYKSKKSVSGAVYALKGDIIVSTVRPTRGAIAIIKEDKIAVSNAFAILTFNNKCNNEFMKYILLSKKFLNYLGKHSTGATYPTCSKDDIVNYEIQLPDIAVQEEFIKEMKYINEFIKTKKKIVSDLDLLIKCKIDKIISDSKEEVKLGEYVTRLCAGKSLAGVKENENKVLKSGAVTFDNFNMNEYKYLPLDYNPNKEHLVKKGDVIISRMNTEDLVGATAYVWDVLPNSYLPDRLWRAEINSSNAMPLFVWQLLIHKSSKKKIKSIATGTSGTMKNISKSNLLDIMVPNVSLNEQKNFDSYCSQLFNLRFTINKEIKDVQTMINNKINNLVTD